MTQAGKGVEKALREGTEKRKIRKKKSVSMSEREREVERDREKRYMV
jgi:hypothetical protein